MQSTVGELMPGARGVRVGSYHISLLTVLLAFFFISGASGLMYQIVWLKLLTLSFGVTIYATSTILAGFMAGLALGSFAGGRFSEIARRPLRLYGLLELLIGGVGLLMPGAFQLLQEVYRSLYPLLPDSLLSLSLARFALAFVILLVPTTLMGATLPVVVKSRLATSSGLGRGISLLYALNTFGAVAGTFAAGVFLIGDLGLQGTTLAAVTFNVVAGLGAIVLDLKVDRPSKDDPAMDEASRPSPAPVEAEYGRPVLLAVLIVFGLSGFTSLAYEVIWARVLTYFLNGTTYAYTIMLCTFLLGIAAGSYLVNHFINRRWNWVLILAGIEFLVGVTSLLSMRVIGEIYQALEWFGTLRYIGWLVQNEVRFMAVAIALAILPTTLLLGVAFPIGLQIFSRGKDQVGRRVGNLYGVNVFGSIIGSFVAGFVLVPLLGSQSSLTLVSLANWLMVVLLVWTLWSSRGIALRLGAIIASLVVMLSLVAVSPDMHRRIFESRFPDEQVVWYEEGLENAVSVHRDRAQGLVMYLNGQHQANTAERVVRLHHLIGHVPMVLHPDPRDVLVIGLGGGATAGAVTQHPVRQIDLIELSESVVRAAPLFKDINYDVLKQPSLKLRVDDGRNYLLLTSKKYDVITADIIQPYHAGSGNLYSREYYQMARNALKPDGLMVQWLENLNEGQHKVIMRTFLSVFPHATLWADRQLMVGSPRQLRVDPAVIEAKFADERVRAALVPLGLRSGQDVLRMYNGGPEQMGRYVGPGPVSTDNQPFNEYFRSIREGRDRRSTDRGSAALEIVGDVSEILIR